MINKKTKVILDTNFLLLPEQSGLDIFDEINSLMDRPYELFIIDRTMVELEELTRKGKVKDRVAANVGMELIDSKKVKKIDSKGLKGNIVDDMILDAADDDTIVATIDKNLKRELLHEGYAVIEMVNNGFLRIRRKRERR